jgi:hypothetical protein
MTSQDGTDFQLLMIAHACHSLKRYVEKFQGGDLSSLSVWSTSEYLGEISGHFHHSSAARDHKRRHLQRILDT